VTDDPGTPAADDPTAFAVAEGALLTATKTANGSLVEGTTLTYTVVISNAGSGVQGDNPGDEFTDVLPASLTLVSATATSGAALATIGTNTVTWNGSIPSGGDVTITITAQIEAGTQGATVSNQGTLAFDGNADGINEGTAVTDDPALGGAADPTSFVVVAPAVVEVPTLSELGAAAFVMLLAMAALLALRQRAA
jgi:uncharacterized repeat protein (TIGR01451 family)